MRVGVPPQKVDGRQLDDTDYELLRTILKFASTSGGVVNLRSLLRVATPVVCQDKKGDCTKSDAYSRLYRRLKKLASQGLVSLEKSDGLLWVSLTLRGIYLICIRRNSNKAKRQEHWTKRVARELLSNVNNPPYFRYRKDGTNKFVSSLVGLFSEYVRDTGDKRVVFVREDVKARDWEKLEKEVVDDSDIVIVPYKTRFTNKGMLVQKLKKYDDIFEASKQFGWAVFLTLTTDPSRFPNLHEANRELGHSLNRFLSRLRNHFKKKDLRLHYIAVYEFTRSGLLHVHLIIFGVRYLLPVRVISKWWSEAGQGRIVYIYSLKNEDGRWVWARRRPRDVKSGEGAEDYLKKYLRKALRVVDQDVGTMDVTELRNLAMYWVTNKRFFTYSRSLLEKKKERRVVRVSRYVFVGVFYTQDIPDWVWFLPHTVYSSAVSSSPPPPTVTT